MRKKKSRFIYMIIVGIIVSFLLHVIIKVDANHFNRFYDVLTSVFITILIWEGNLRIDSWMNMNFPWLTKPGKRICIHLPVSIVFSVLGIYLPMLFASKYICILPDNQKDLLMISCIVIGCLITFVILSIEIGTQFFGHWKTSLVEIEKYKTESLQAQLQNLKNQINPHFLFNNMSVLSSLVYKDQDKAVDFINQLSKVYRYLLDNKDSELVTLEDELNFIRSYTYLLQIRFDTNIKFDIVIEENCLNKYLPPMALQILIENVIKHNEISSEKSLTVNIKSDNDMLEVCNTLQLRINTEESSKTGLKNIKERYKYFTDRQVEIVESDKQFCVRIPLLQTS